MVPMNQQRSISPGLWITLAKGMVSFLILMAALWGFFLLIFSPIQSSDHQETVVIKEMVEGWKRLSDNRRGRVIYAQPPHMIILDLKSGKRKIVPHIEVEGGSGRKMRGLTPRPFWSPDGTRFIYRFKNKIYISNEKGEKKEINNVLMDASKETRWSWWRGNDIDWAVGPSKEGNIIMINISDPSITKTIYNGGDVKWWCEVTGNGKYVVYDTGNDIYVTPVEDRSIPIKISRRQSCRPCAAPDNRVAWLPASHTNYQIFNAENGKSIQKLLAPANEGIYRLNWSNHPDFAVHMFGSAENQRMHVRRISMGGRVFIGYGWDPDLWVESTN